MTAAIHLHDHLGRVVTFDYVPITASFRECQAVYLFIRPGTPANGLKILYVGETVNLRARLANHERWPAARNLGATMIGAIVTPSDAYRFSLEKHLIQSFQPMLNEQHRGLGLRRGL